MSTPVTYEPTPAYTERHYDTRAIPQEHVGLEDPPFRVRNVGWTLGNDCPYRCRHCYSLSARRRGMDLNSEIVKRIVGQLSDLGVETVNLGGNEPIFTNGLRVQDSVLPEIIERLHAEGIEVGLTTSGISAIALDKHFPAAWRKLNDLDVSFDSPFEAEHNENRGAKIYSQALRALALARRDGLPHSIVMCGMSWNFDIQHLEALLELGREYDANVRINPLKPVEPQHMAIALSPEQYYAGFEYLLSHTSPVDLGEPPLAALSRLEGAHGCPCGAFSFRIHSITPDGQVPVSPCVYLHDYKAGDLVQDNLRDIVQSPSFATFRRRNAHPELIPGCAGCSLLETCRGGCPSRSYLHHLHETGQRSLFAADPYCPQGWAEKVTFPTNPQLDTSQHLVHRNYLCTWIGRPS